MPAGVRALDLALLADLLAIARSIELAAKDRGATRAELAPLREAQKKLRDARELTRRCCEAPGPGSSDAGSDAGRARALADEAIGRLGAVLNAAMDPGAPESALTRSLRARRARRAEAKGRAA